MGGGGGPRRVREPQRVHTVQKGGSRRRESTGCALSGAILRTASSRMPPERTMSTPQMVSERGAASPAKLPHGVVTVFGVTQDSRARPSSARMFMSRSDAATYCAQLAPSGAELAWGRGGLGRTHVALGGGALADDGEQHGAGSRLEELGVRVERRDRRRALHDQQRSRRATALKP